MDDVRRLIHDIRACQICADLPLGPKPIVQFNAKSKILIAGQAPGRITHHKGIAFDDPSGNRLRAWLGVSRDAFYDPDCFAIVPMGFCFPGTGNGGDLPPRPECAPTWRHRILDHLTSVELVLIIGRYAIDWHAPEHAKSTVTHAVRDWETHWPRQLILPHPSPRNNRWLKQNPWFERQIVPTLQDRVHQLTGRHAVPD